MLKLRKLLDLESLEHGEVFAEYVSFVLPDVLKSILRVWDDKKLTHYVLTLAGSMANATICVKVLFPEALGHLLWSAMQFGLLYDV